ncbi:hypothetical protein CDD80_4471 [Ophiocordyceps camponoti-rufipedis]|uniref:Gfd2/YDR514C-like C-terminal domain-containing protein n=1 Tax=Ophiocordyceps camponoti-rufipedis TaxID=2004952 RepID=A0A2C5YY29_9HYPO|nr:hypothetical protein CDD80_4471 [Ophiocordyceps camponoti-rufipedis]
MADPDTDLAKQLSLLQDVLGRAVTLEDPGIVIGSDDDDDHVPKKEPVPEPRWERLHAKDKKRPKSRKPSKFSPQKGPDSKGPGSTSVDCSELSVGDTLDRDVEFCPWKAITAYPNMFIGKTNRPRASPYFDNILEERCWDFFYLHDPRKKGERPHLFVQTAQFEDFLAAINRTLQTALTIPIGNNNKKFCIVFGSDNTPRPRFLLQSDGKDSLSKVSWPEMFDSDVQSYKKASPMAQDDFDSALKFSTVKSSDKSKKAEDRARKRALQRHSMMQQAQSFLGLGENGSKTLPVVFVCIDVEALETPPHHISEIGIAILDTARTRRNPPDAGGSGWWQFIEAHHLRTKEFSGMVNHKYVMGCPEAFDFGTSDFPTKDQLVDAVKKILQPYMDKDKGLVFIGHDTASDVRYLSQIGLEVLDLPGMLCEIDTKALHQAWRDSEDSRSLEAVLADLNIPNKNLHNAGNDAVFTMRAVLGLALEQLRKVEAELKGDDYLPALWEK